MKLLLGASFQTRLPNARREPNGRAAHPASCTSNPGAAPVSRTCWARRAKVPLSGISRECATVPLLNGGWRVSAGSGLEQRLGD
jgi:hypothetical protein